MKHKRIIYLFLIISLLAALTVGCSKAEEPPQSTAPTATPEPPELLPAVRISELMASNKSTLSDAAGLFPDWVELYNYGSETVDLSGCSLSDGKNSWSFGNVTMAPGQYLLIFCDGNGGEGLYADFSLSSMGEPLSLSSPRGTLIDSVSFGEAGEDVSLYRSEAAELLPSRYPSPGFENSPEGYTAFQSSIKTDSPLLISEVMTYNEWYLPLEYEYYDLVELINVSDSSVNLGDYYLSDSGSDRAAYKLPDKTLAPGELYVLHCTETPNGVPFALNSDAEQLFLSRSDGSLCDYVRLQDIRYGGSMGRMAGENGFFYFDTASPGEINSAGARCRAESPVSLDKDGVFTDVESVSVTLSAAGQIYYTLDGSLPDESDTLYTQPIVLTETTVVRAVSIEPGKLNSLPLSLSYIINEGHDLPVVSLVAEPDDLFGYSGIYAHPKKDWERQCSLSLYDGQEGFTIDGGMKIHGATSRVAQSKKSMKVTFRPRYSGALEYDLFENGVTTFSSILLRSAQEDAVSTQMRDIIMHELASQMCPELPTQDYKYCVLYINGEYWGLYALREAHSTAHYANHYGYDEELVEHWKEKWPDGSSPAELYYFVRTHDMSDPANYAYVKEHLHIESFIAWSIIEAYSGNLDLNSPNVRFYYSPEDDQMRYALVDLDLSMYPIYSGFSVAFDTYYAFSGFCWRLLESPEYCQQYLKQLSEYLHGPLADENVRALINSLADEISSEIPRDYDRWYGTVEAWENMIEKHLIRFLELEDGRARTMAYLIREYIDISDEEFDRLFGDLPITE